MGMGRIEKRENERKRNLLLRFDDDAADDNEVLFCSVAFCLPDICVWQIYHNVKFQFNFGLRSFTIARRVCINVILDWSHESKGAVGECMTPFFSALPLPFNLSI